MVWQRALVRVIRRGDIHRGFSFFDHSPGAFSRSRTQENHDESAANRHARGLVYLDVLINCLNQYSSS